MKTQSNSESQDQKDIARVLETRESIRAIVQGFKLKIQKESKA